MNKFIIFQKRFNLELHLQIPCQLYGHVRAALDDVCRLRRSTVKCSIEPWELRFRTQNVSNEDGRQNTSIRSAGMGTIHEHTVVRHGMAWDPA